MGHLGVRNVKHGFWDETFRARVDGLPFRSAEDEFLESEGESHAFDHSRLAEAIELLTERQRFVLRCFYGLECERFTVQEIADLMRWHHSTVQEHLSAAERNLREILDPANE